MDANHQNATGERIAGPDTRPDANAGLLDVRGVAAMLHCSSRHVYRLADSGKMPRPLKLGQLCRWSRAQLGQWIADGCPPVRSVRGGVRP